MKKSYSAPSMRVYGTIAELTRSGECEWSIDLGLDPDKNIGFPQDYDYRFLATCDAGGGYS
ncbi:hypothetical protein [Longibacter sp.]|uniref:hypothetical protein n=1 Tax=Longibacter sp. TaxID=2045415 RepID=UPI003EBB355D